MKITVDYWRKSYSIPTNKFDWSATEAGNYDPEQPVGYGATEKEAALDLIELMWEKERISDDEKAQLIREWE